RPGTPRAGAVRGGQGGRPVRESHGPGLVIGGPGRPGGVLSRASWSGPVLPRRDEVPASKHRSQSAGGQRGGLVPPGPAPRIIIAHLPTPPTARRRLPTPLPGHTSTTFPVGKRSTDNPPWTANRRFA